MHQALKDAALICKTLMRNGYDAHIINAPLQEFLINTRKQKPERLVIDIACDLSMESLARLYPGSQPLEKNRAFAQLDNKENIFRFYPLDFGGLNLPDYHFLKLNPSLAEEVDPALRKTLGMQEAPPDDPYEGFAEVKDGSIRILGLPDETLRKNYILAVRALRFAANFDVPIEPNTWMAIVRASVRILDYVPAHAIMDEWRKVAAESMYRFVELLYSAHLLQELFPEMASLACVVQQNDKGEITGNVLEHTLKCMRYYPEAGMHYDWLGVMAMFFHDVGKLFTAEYFNGRWTYFQHHKVGAKVTRNILRRVHFDQAEADIICHLVNEHMRFHFMLTDKGIRRFKSLGETERLIAMARADLMAREDSFTSFNHNMKYLDRAEMPEQLIEPLLNGNEIMRVANLNPGKMVGAIRGALLKAQQEGRVLDRDDALEFCRNYQEFLQEE